MPNISKINQQLKSVHNEINELIAAMPSNGIQDIGIVAASIESLCKAQKALIETQTIIFVECTESDIDMPTLPLFIEERDESDPE